MFILQIAHDYDSWMIFVYVYKVKTADRFAQDSVPSVIEGWFPREKEPAMQVVQ